MRRIIENFYSLVFGDDLSDLTNLEIRGSVPYKNKVFMFWLTAALTVFILILVCLDIIKRL